MYYSYYIAHRPRTACSLHNKKFPSCHNCPDIGRPEAAAPLKRIGVHGIPKRGTLYSKKRLARKRTKIRTSVITSQLLLLRMKVVLTEKAWFLLWTGAMSFYY